jgi:DNA-binding transcriptional ArsR family regulator
MRKSAALDALLPKTRQGILAAILMRPERAWYVSELARRMGVPSSSLQRELQDLTDAGILKTHRQGRMVYYQANTGSPLFSDLRGLLLKTAGLADVLAEALKPLAARLRVAFVYGSVASGNEQSDSDVDLMVVGSVSPAELSVSLRHARDVLGREINPTLYRPGEYDKKIKAKDHFLVSVLHTAKIFVIGDADALGQSAE